MAAEPVLAAQACDAGNNGGVLPVGNVTLLFTDIEGSTSLLRRLGERYDDVLSQHFVILRAAIARHDGIEVNSDGDALFAAFAHAHDALDACVEAQLALATHPWPSDDDLRVRMGLHTGEVRAAGRDYVGLTVHQAARVVSAAHGGQVVCWFGNR